MAMMLDEGSVSDADLIGLAREGDRQAFGELVERHYDFIHRVAWRWCGSRTDAEDITQEVCVRLGKAIRAFKGESAFTTWLYAMTLNAARDLRRKATREVLKAEAFGVHALISGEIAPEPDGAAERLWAVVRQLPDKQRDAVLLVYG
ncbi:RNA polymerase sigma factor, partial [Rhizobiaceae sp. 2RAB30]